MSARVGRRHRRRGEGPTLAERADRHALYQRAVQRPESDIALFGRLFRELRGRTPRSLREDFCGTAHFATEWVRRGRGRSAVGVDLDEGPLGWGRRHNLTRLSPRRRPRVQLAQADVREVTGPQVDLICAMNFSFCVFKTRATLRRYFAAARAGLVADGLLLVEIYGGTEAIVATTEERDCGRFVYRWEQERYDPVTSETLCHIHFDFPDGSCLERAFTYDWRLWTIPEIRETMAEAGFAASAVYWEETDDEGDGTGFYRRTEGEENQECWMAFVVGVK
ncbi:MAG: class I SAM-dependent methyltransferase [Deltaproteobacteria bacterium]|nr:class I SAM-dependent methyltransferase [Deltaproteobacteria bacterium]